MLDLVAQPNELGRALDPYPQAARLVAAAENAGPGELQGKPACPQSRQRLVDVGRDGLVGLADEPQGQVKVAGIHPLGPRYTRAQQRQLQLELRWKADPDKQTQHCIRPRSARGPAIQVNRVRTPVWP